MQIVDTSFIFKKRCVDLEENTFKSQKSEFYEAWLANFGPFFSNLGLLKARSPSNLVMNNSWCPPILPQFFFAFLGRSVSDLEKRKQKNCREKTLPWPAPQHWVKNLWRLHKDFTIPSSIPCCVCKSYSSRALCWHIYDVHGVSPLACLRSAIYRVIYFLKNCSLNHSLIRSSNMWNWNKEVSLKIFFCHLTLFHYQVNGALAVSGYLIRSTRGLSTSRKIIYSITEIYLYVSGHIWIKRSDVKNSMPHLDTI